ncbi:MAG: PTS sugar transporter subunit IIA [Elusimicrobia bacterium]|nr:PTS sugar transporter subunit IIA [Elusimicrobiota bacterium]
MKIMDFLSKDCILSELKGKTKAEVILELVNILAKNKLTKSVDKTIEAIMKRESTGSTGIGQGVAIPHAKSDSVSKIVASLGISKTGIDFDSLDGEPVYIVFLMVTPPDSTSEHLQAIAKISCLLKNKLFRQLIMDAQTSQDIIKIIEDATNATNVQNQKD